MGVSLFVHGSVGFGATLSLGAVNQLVNKLCAPAAMIEDATGEVLVLRGPTGLTCQVTDGLAIGRGEMGLPKSTRISHKHVEIGRGQDDDGCWYVRRTGTNAVWLLRDSTQREVGRASGVAIRAGDSLLLAMKPGEQPDPVYQIDVVATEQGRAAAGEEQPPKKKSKVEDSCASAAVAQQKYLLQATDYDEYYDYEEDFEYRYGEDGTDGTDDQDERTLVSLAELNIQINYHVAMAVHHKQKLTFGCGMKDCASPIHMLSGVLVDRIFGFFEPSHPLPFHEPGKLLTRGDYENDTKAYKDVVGKLVTEVERLGGSPVSAKDPPCFEFNVWYRWGHLFELQEQLRNLHYSKYHTTVELRHAVSGGDCHEYYRNSKDISDRVAWFFLTSVDAAPSGVINEDHRVLRTNPDGEDVGFVSPLGALTVAPGVAEVLETHLANLFPDEDVKNGFS
eukprot:COSAG02_NODE_1652_length_11493_cov_82.045111_1_plen_448_part_10